MVRATLDAEYDTAYEYSSSHGGLLKVTNPDKSWTKYFYNTDGIYAGISHYTSSGILLRSVKFKDIGPGHLEMTEYPGNKVSSLKYNTKGELAYIKTAGSPSYQIHEKNNEKKIFMDDLVCFYGYVM